MRVVLVGPFGMRPKGTVKARALPLAQSLVALGHNVSILIPPWDWPADAGSSYAIGEIQIDNVSLGPNLPVLFHVFILLRLLHQVLRQDPDVVHVFKPKGYSGAVAVLLRPLRWLHLTRARIVVDTDDWEGKGGWNDVAGYGYLARLLFPLQERWTLRTADAVTAASAALRNMALALGLPMRRVFYVPNGPSDPAGRWLSDDCPTQAGVDAACNVVLLYTRFLELDPSRVAAILRRVCNEVPDVELRVVGAGLHGEETVFAEVVAAAGLADRVFMLGWMTEDGITTQLAHAAVAIYPYEDTLINRTKCSAKLIELLSFGLPVVADAVGQNCEYIEHGVSGLLVPSGDVEAFAQAVVDLLRDKPRRQLLGANARARIKERFLWSILVAQVEAAYRC
ncbi:MAG: glycosyltransferase [Chloroflexota bacterium]|nr:MAG: glycosyltransferase [Chloroflexota bacterium]